MKAVYELKCLKVEAKYETKKKQAYRDLKQQEQKELDEIERIYEAGMEPIKVRHAEKLSEIRERYRTAAPESGLHASAVSQTPSSPTVVTVSVSPTSEDCGENSRKEPNFQSIAANCWPAAS